ncbi:diaminopimelate epimerase [Limosilactobacillus secaliphilus]|uniref:Diaminopimelate epimerase n=1 Tax=Limosilactobacillus secaliphilus TaxID=396268 RepID=A0A0R2IBF5_9LACO|nr:diaminopimelate epimerase [Limosilactobacillus secaliphilus]KRN58829.1 diaminopimelate epimerase [Limosilactobacillus secaliphilus]
MTQLLKVHGSQNHFFILDQMLLKKPLADKELRRLAQQLCDPKTGILNGADGLLAVTQADHPGPLARMRVINADGSEASMCGNGLRTVARYLTQKTGQTSFTIQTMHVDLRVAKQKDLAPNVPAFAVEISPVLFSPESLPFKGLGNERMINDYVPELQPDLRFTAVAVPNPHLISFVDETTLKSDVLGQLGRYLNGTNPYFTDGVNVSFAVFLGPNRLFVRTFERGVGFTNACGTGMAATSLAFCLTHPEQAALDQPIDVFNPGGKVQVIVHFDRPHYWMELIGNATVTDVIDVDEEALHAAHVVTDQVHFEQTKEQAAYVDYIHSLPRPINVNLKH